MNDDNRDEPIDAAAGLTETNRNQFQALKSAFAMNHVGLMSCIDKRTGERVAMIAIVRPGADNAQVVIPFALLIGNEAATANYLPSAGATAIHTGKSIVRTIVEGGGNALENGPTKDPS